MNSLAGTCAQSSPTALPHEPTVSLELQVISTDSALRGLEQGESRVEEGKRECSCVSRSHGSCWLVGSWDRLCLKREVVYHALPYTICRMSVCCASLCTHFAVHPGSLLHNACVFGTTA